MEFLKTDLRGKHAMTKAALSINSYDISVVLSIHYLPGEISHCMC